jgi:hypothetical protein
MSVDALHFVYKNKIASDMAILSFRKFNPTSIYVVIGDGGEDYYDVCTRHDCFYLHSPIHLGYPEIPHGFRKEKVLEYLRRFYAAVSLCRASHVIIMEDDVCIINHIRVEEQDEMLVTENCLGNLIHPAVLQAFMQVSGNADLDNFYGMGGGSIFNRKTFLASYPGFLQFVDANFEALQGLYPALGWTDCIISLAMMFAGKKHRINPQLHELGVWGQDHRGRNYEGIEEELRSKHAILHHYKKYYDLAASAAPGAPDRA